MGPGQVTKPGFNPHPGAAGLPQKRGSSRLRREPLVTPGSLRRGLPPAPSPEEEEVVASRELPCTSPRGKLVLPGTSLPLELTLPCPPLLKPAPRRPHRSSAVSPTGRRPPEHLAGPDTFSSRRVSSPNTGLGRVEAASGIVLRGGAACASRHRSLYPRPPGEPRSAQRRHEEKGRALTEVRRELAGRRRVPP